MNVRSDSSGKDFEIDENGYNYVPNTSGLVLQAKKCGTNLIQELQDEDIVVHLINAELWQAFCQLGTVVTLTNERR